MTHKIQKNADTETRNTEIRAWKFEIRVEQFTSNWRKTASKYVMNRLTFLFSVPVLAFFISACAVTTAEQIDVDSKPLVMPKNVAAKPRIVAFGDSLTAGFGLEEN